MRRGRLPRPSFAPLLAILLACGADEPETRRGGVVNGSVDTGDACVVQLVIHAADGSTGACTGTVVTPHVVLTAAHCVAPQSVGRDAWLEIAGDGGARTRVERTDFAPAFDGLFLPGGHDVGVAVTGTALPASPLPLPQAPLPAGLGAARIVGLGVADAGDLDGSTLGVRRQAEVSVAGVSERFLELAEGAGACEGDSGGPVLAHLDGAATETLVGVVSYGVDGCTGTIRAANLASELTFLAPIIAADGQQPLPEPGPPESEAPEAGVPEPGSGTTHGCRVAGGDASGTIPVVLVLVLLLLRRIASAGSPRPGPRAPSPAGRRGRTASAGTPT